LLPEIVAGELMTNDFESVIDTTVTPAGIPLPQTGIPTCRPDVSDIETFAELTFVINPTWL
jgi:hypothetical protein